jgi:hypothetical protein
MPFNVSDYARCTTSRSIVSPRELLSVILIFNLLLICIYLAEILVMRHYCFDLF